MDYADLVYKEQTDIVVITLNRPEKRNVFSHQMIESLIQALETANQDDRIKAIVITGEGSAFCAGGDVNDMISGALRSWGLKDYLWKHLQRIPLLMEDTDKLLVAAVNGPAAGGGFDLALACDLRTAGSKAKFMSSYVKLGLAPGFGGCFFLPRIVGLGHAMEILVSGREVLAEEALRIGMVNRLFSDDTLIEDTLSWVKEVVTWPRPALKVIKRGVYQGLRSDLKAHLDYLSSQDALLSLTEEHQEIINKIAKK
jgi:enoyl-CoA hydratase/carnithine racemase